MVARKWLTITSHFLVDYNLIYTENFLSENYASVNLT